MTSTEGERVRRVSSLASSTSARVAGTRRRTKATAMVAGPLMVMAIMTLRVASPPAVFSSCPRSSSPRQLLLHCSATTLLSAGAHVSSAPLHCVSATPGRACVVRCVNRLATHVVTGGSAPPPLSPVPCLLLHRRRAMLQFDKHTALLCATETNLFETNRQNVTVQMQNHDGNLLARSILQPVQRSAFGKMS